MTSDPRAYAVRGRIHQWHEKLARHEWDPRDISVAFLQRDMSAHLATLGIVNDGDFENQVVLPSIQHVQSQDIPIFLNLLQRLGEERYATTRIAIHRQTPDDVALTQESVVVEEAPRQTDGRADLQALMDGMSETGTAGSNPGATPNLIPVPGPLDPVGIRANHPPTAQTPAPIDVDATQMDTDSTPSTPRNTRYTPHYYRDFTKPWKRDPKKGAWTNAPRPEYPTVFRPYGSNTRDRVVGFRKYTRMHHLGYDAEVVESRAVPPFIAPSAALGQSGAPSITSHIAALRPGPHHFLFTTRRG